MALRNQRHHYGSMKSQINMKKTCKLLIMFHYASK
uniref:Uncharacterized protein n=1 Tax=Anguilla anguilla TaxID=7936 RepID=A0A0E9SZ55_ANGAN